MNVDKLYALRIKSGVTDEPSGGVISSFRSKPIAEKVEYFKTEAARAERRQQIEKAVSEIGLCAWLVSMENDEILIKDKLP